MALPEIKQADFAGNFFAARDQARQQQQGAQRNALSGELMRGQINQLAIQGDMQQRAATQEDQVRRARQTYSEVDAVINAPPGQASAVLRDLATRDPSIADAAKRLSESGLDLSNDEQIRQSLYVIRAHVAGIAGISPPPPKSNDPGELVQIVGPNGQPTLVPRAQAVNQRPYIKPEKPPEQASTQLVSRPTPDGMVQDFAYDPRSRNMTPVGTPYRKQADLAPKDVSAVKQKLTTIEIARQQIANAREKLKALRGTFSAGLGGNWIATLSGKAFDASIDGLRQTITGLTRTPGVGSMSDFETRLNQAQLPNRGDYEDVISQKLDQLSGIVDSIGQGYADMLGGDKPAPASTQAVPSNASGQIIRHPSGATIEIMQ